MEIIDSGSQPLKGSVPACGSPAGCDSKFIKALADMFGKYADQCNGTFWETLTTIPYIEPNSESSDSSQETPS